jgi:hypothetical protein
VIRYIFVAAFVYIVFRMVQVILRILSSGARREEFPGKDGAPAGPRSLEKFEDVRDADFEDLPPGKQPEAKKGEGEESKPE